MHILITGGAGFIGSHLADHLLERGHRVRALDNLSPQVHGRVERPAYLSADVDLVRGDVRDREAVRRALAGIDAVFHLASAVGVGQSMYEIEHYTSTNNVGTAVLLEALVEHPVERLVVASSMSLYGERAGALSVVCPDAAEAELVLGQLKATVRRNYSSPPIHAGLVVAKVLGEPALRTRLKQWRGPISVPILFAGETVLRDSLQIARYAEEIGANAADLFPQEITRVLLNLIGNKFVSLAFSWLLNQRIKDTLCGTKALTKAHYRRIAAQRARHRRLGHSCQVGDVERGGLAADVHAGDAGSRRHHATCRPGAPVQRNIARSAVESGFDPTTRWPAETPAERAT